ncbi:hypothetical protein [Parasphingopyxis sp.]|uniref:CC_3452 family protein n=1 Tax=Parasphingopyxis sp. TaxID=1920299 RepID=UPI002639FCBA|nr:hypothetical protein [Parasphingopyxis sp.]
MQRSLSLILSLMTVAFLFTATGAEARTPYQATLAEATDERVLVIRNAPWVCDGTECSTDGARSRPANVCHAFVRELGAVTSFIVDSEAMTEEELARCNEAAG